MIIYEPTKRDYEKWNSAIEITNMSRELANELIAHKEFYKRIARKQKPFDYSNISPLQIAKLLIGYSNNIKIVLFKKTFFSGNAYSNFNNPNIIFLNVLKLKNRSYASIAATLIHEFVHLVDFYYPQFKFDHGDNNPNGKSNTAPYWIDKLAYRMLTGRPAKMVNHHDLLTDEDIQLIINELDDKNYAQQTGL